MARCLVTAVNPSEILLENILTFMEGEVFSKDKAAAIVGGPAKLEMLIASGEIEAVKKTQKQNGKWFCNAAQVLRNCRNMRNRK